MEYIRAMYSSKSFRLISLFVPIHRTKGQDSLSEIFLNLLMPMPEYHFNKPITPSFHSRDIAPETGEYEINETYTTEELLMLLKIDFYEEMLTPDGVCKAKEAALQRIRKLCRNSAIPLWRYAHSLTQKAAQGR